jgi:hypothetical protein
MKRFQMTVRAILAAALLATGCGSDDDDGNQEAYSHCEDTATILGDAGVVSDLLGLSADDLLAAAGGGFQVTAVWATETAILTQSPLGGETEATVTIAYEGGEVREIDSQPIEGENEIAMDCRPRLEVEVTITVATADAALDETWEAVLSRSVSYETDEELPLMLMADFDPGGLNGDYEIVAIEGPAPDAVTGRFSTTAGEPFQGTLDILVEQSSGGGDDGTVSQARHVALSWGGAR